MGEAVHETPRPPTPPQGNPAKVGRPGGTGWSEHADELRRRLTGLETKLAEAQCALEVDGDRARHASDVSVGWPAHAAEFRRHLAVIESRAAEIHAIKQSGQTPPRDLATELAGRLDDLAGHWNELESAHEQLVSQRREALETHQSSRAASTAAQPDGAIDDGAGKKSSAAHSRAADTRRPRTDTNPFASGSVTEETPIGSPAAAVLSTAVEAEEDESLESYMARLLGRVHQQRIQRGDLGSATADATSQPVELPEAGRSRPTGRRPIQQKPKNRAAYVRRSIPPEQNVDLTAMRQLANASTRLAINKHERRRWLQMALVQMTAAWVVLVISIVVLQWVSRGAVVPFVIAVTGLVAAAFLGLKAAIHLRQIVIQTRRDASQTWSSDSTEADDQRELASTSTDDARD